MTSTTNGTHHDARTGHAARAQAFRALHSGPVLVLPNAWDVASAVLVSRAGAAAVATTSAGVSWSLGAADGEQLDRDRAVDLVARITAVVDVPVTADLEAGYGTTTDDLRATVQAVLDAGAVGINIEDNGGSPLRSAADQAERIAVVRSTAEAAGVPLFINARTDTYLLQVGEPESRLAETTSRAEAYLAAGADGIFVPGVTDPATIRQLTGSVPAPVNVMAGPGAPTVAELADLGVRRVSVGAAIAQAAYALAHRAAVELLSLGTYTDLREGTDYAAMNAALATR